MVVDKQESAAAAIVTACVKFWSVAASGLQGWDVAIASPIQ
jgi:hypothetical protein